MEQIKNIIYQTLCEESDFDKMDLIHQEQAKTKYRVIADKLSNQLEPLIMRRTGLQAKFEYVTEEYELPEAKSAKITKIQPI